MSSYLVSRETIAEIVYALTELDMFDDEEIRDIWFVLTPDALGQNLWNLNQKAVNGRYGESAEAPTYKHPAISHVSTVQAFKSFDCYIYQCSEYPVYDDPAYHKLKRMRDTLGCAVMRDTEEYRNAVWGR
jgi:hypothetical protein